MSLLDILIFEMLSYILQNFDINRIINVNLISNVSKKRVTHILTFALKAKLMRLGSPNRIDVFESNLKSEFDRQIIVDLDSNDLIELTISIFDII